MIRPVVESLTVFVPKAVVDRSKLLPEQVQNFERVTGILKTRRFPISTSGMIEQAVKRAKLGSPKRYGAVIVVTQSPTRLSPCHAVDVHRQLGMNPSAMAFDLNQSCDGFIYGVHLASRMAWAENWDSVLLVCADRLRYSDQALIFSDAVAVAEIAPGYAPASFYNDGEGAAELFCTAGGSMNMNGGAVFDFVTKRVPPFIGEFFERYGEPKFFCQHQSNRSMMNIIENRSLSEGTTSLRSLHEYGNQSMVSIPTALAMNEEKILGAQVALCGYGAGWSMAMTKLTWSDVPVSQIVEG